MAYRNRQPVPPLQAGPFCGHVGTEADREGQSMVKRLKLALTLLVPGPLEYRTPKHTPLQAHPLSQ